jgi:predicted 2-oxoglutarate/Fe(II)-dependent dioxygenase YbiX
MLPGGVAMLRIDVLISIAEVLSKEQVRRCHRVMDAAEWVDGRGTAGPQSGSVKCNVQLPEGSAAAQELGEMGAYGAVALGAFHFCRNSIEDIPATL